LTALHPDPRERYVSVESLVRDIEHYLKNEPLDAQPAVLRYRLGKFVRRNRNAVLATAAMLTLTVSLVAFFVWRLSRERNAALAAAARVQHLQDFMTGLLQGGDQDAGPAADLRVTTMIDRGVQQAATLDNEPQIQADLYQTLGSMSQKLGRLDQSEYLLKKALAVRLSSASTDHAGIVKTSLALAVVRAEEGHAKEAEQQARRDLDEIRSDKSNNKSLVGQAELALGTVMIEAGEQEQSIPVLTESLNDLRSVDGGSPSLQARALSALADANIYTGNYDAADDLNRRALEIDRSTYGENNPHVADELGTLPRPWRFAVAIRRLNRWNEKPWKSWRNGTGRIIRKLRVN